MLTACFAIFFCLVALCLATSHSVAWALLGGVALFWGLGLKKSFTNRQLWTMAWNKCKKSLIVVRIILLIGVITGVWRCGGVIAFCVVKGVGLVAPGLFLAAAFALCALFSYVLGTSYGVSSTLGVILMALARSGGISPAVAAGVVLSGVYFGDRCSPASSAGALVAAVTETDHYRNVRQMLRSGILPTALTFGICLLLSVRHPMTWVDAAALSALGSRFSMTWLCLAPAIIMFVLPLLKVPIHWTILGSTVAAAALAWAVQDFSPLEILSAAWSGYHPEDPALSAVLSGGGVTSMASSCLIVALTGLYSGILEGTGSLEGARRRAAGLADRLGRFPAAIAVSTLCAAVFCNQAVTSILCQQILGGCYGDREELALDIANSGLMISGLIPWSIACSVPLAMLGVDAGALPYACLLWLTPVCWLFTKGRFYPVKSLQA